MPGLLPHIDPDGLLEYSVVFTDRSLNHMSKQFQQVMLDISANLKSVYNSDAVAIVPGGGTYGMEAVARQFATDQHCLVIRNGYFSFRWSQIFDAGSIPASSTVMMARRIEDDNPAPFAPPPIEEVEARIQEQKPAVVFAPHVETASGILLPDDYITRIGAAVKAVGGLFVLDCIASGTVWVDTKACNVDVLISAPQKGWSSTPCSALIMMNQRALDRMAETQSTSFACDLKKWHEIMMAYENGGFAYHATMPTDALKQFRDTVLESKDYGFDELKAQQLELGSKVRTLFADHGYKSVAAEGFEAPGVAVFFTNDSELQMGKPFLANGLQIAAGVPLMCEEGDDYRSFRIGLFGLDKLMDVDGAVERIKTALQNVV